HTAAEESKTSPNAADGDPPRRLRVLIANEKRERLAVLAQVVGGLGHDVVAREIHVSEVAASTAREQPDVALVGLGLSSEHALELIGEIVREASCPVIALLHASDPTYIHASVGSSPTSSTTTPTSWRAQSTSPCNGSPSTTTCRELSVDEQGSSRQKGF